MFHHIYGQLQGKFSFGKFCQKVGIRSDPPPWLVQKTNFSHFLILKAPLNATRDILTTKVRKLPFLGVSDYFLGRCSLIVGDDQFLGRSAHFLGGILSLFGLSDA